MKKSTTPSSRAPGYDPSKDRLLGTVLGKCKLIKHIGKGGMGDVYLGEHTLLQKKVAVKVLPQDFTRNEELISRFRREAVAAARLEHPNIVQVHDIGSEGDTHYIIMQFVEGKSLQDRLDELAGPLEVKEAARLLADTARGLGAAHKAGIVHRDVKPANVLISDKGEVKVTDFGLAHDQESQSLITMPGAMMGTPHFMSPEQAEGRVADNRSDIYALGVVLYYLATGKRPFIGETHMAVLYKHINEEPPPPKRVNPHVTDQLARIIAKAMAKRPELRYATCEDLARDLDAVVKGGPAPRGATVPVATGRLSHHGTAAARKSTVDVPAPQIPRRKNNQLVLVLSLGSIVVLVIVLALVIILNRGSGKLAASPSPSASPSASPSGPTADTRHEDLLAKAKDAFLLGDKDDEALKLVEDALKIRESKEARDLAGRIFGRIKERKADAALAELEKSAPGRDPEDLLAALDKFLEDHASTKAIEKATALRAKAAEEATAAANFQPEEGFELVSPDSFVVQGQSEGMKLSSTRESIRVSYDPSSAEPGRACVALAPGQYADCVIRFEMRAVRYVNAGAAMRHRDGWFQAVSLPENPPDAWIPVEASISGRTITWAVNRAAMQSQSISKEVAGEGQVGFFLHPGTEVRVRRFRVKRLRSKGPSPSPPPSPSPSPTADPAEKARKELAFLNAIFGEDRKLAEERRYDELLSRVNRDDVETPEAKAALAALRVRVEAADRVMKAFTAALREFPTTEALGFKLRGGMEHKGYVRGLGTEGVTVAVGSGVMTVALRDFDARTVIEVAGRKSKEAPPAAMALFALAEENVKLASEQIFSGKRLKVDAAAAEPILEALLAPPDLALMALPPKDAQPLMDLFLAAKDQFKGGRSGALLERLAQAAKDAALEDDINAIVKLTAERKHKEARKRFLEFVKTHPEHPGIRRLAEGVYPSLMSLGWQPGFGSEADLRAGSSQSKLTVSGDELFAKAEDNDAVTVHVSGLSGDGLAAEFQTGSDIAMAGLLLEFKAANDWVQFVIQGGRAKLWVRRDGRGQSQKIELSEVAVPGTDVWTELAAMRVHDQVWLFVGGKLVHRGERELMDIDGEAGVNFFYDTGKARKFRKHNPE